MHPIDHSCKLVIVVGATNRLDNNDDIHAARLPADSTTPDQTPGVCAEDISTLQAVESRCAPEDNECSMLVLSALQSSARKVASVTVSHVDAGWSKYRNWSRRKKQV